jgi:hypothetical protein
MNNYNFNYLTTKMASKFHEKERVYPKTQFPSGIYYHQRLLGVFGSNRLILGYTHAN